MSWLNWFLTLYLLDVVLSFLVFEWVWKKTERLRIQDDRLGELFPAYARTDAKHMAKWRHTLFILTGGYIPRIIIGFPWFASCTIPAVISLLGHDRSKPLTGLRLAIIKQVNIFYSWSLVVLFGGYRMRREVRQNVDYSYYLGPNYKSQTGPKQISTIVMNHQSWIDDLIAVVYYYPAFLIKAEAKKAPCVEMILEGLRVMYVDRNASKEQRDKAIQDIIDRQTAVESDLDMNNMLIYPEGTQTNGKYLIPFKKGAFAGLKACRPVVLNYENHEWMNTAWDCYGFLEHVLLTFSCPHFTMATVIELPPFIPNDYLFETHKDKGDSKWEIYAWAVRDVMSKNSGKPKIESDPRDKQVFKKFM